MAEVVTIDLDTGAATPRFTIAMPDGFSPGSMTFESASGLMYALATTADQTSYGLLSIDVVDQSMTFVVITGLPGGGRASGLAYDVSTAQLIATIGPGFVEDRIARLDTKSGDVLEISDDIGIGDIDVIGWDAPMARMLAFDFNAGDGFPPIAAIADYFTAPTWTEVGNPPVRGDVGDVAIDPASGRVFVSGFDAAGGFLVEVVAYGSYHDFGAYGVGAQVTGLAFGPVPTDSCPADLDGDGIVGVSDLLIVLGAWGGTDGDIDGDGVTSVADLLVLLAAWGPCP